MKRLGLALAGVFVALALVSAPATAGKKDDTLVWATDRDNPIADPFFLNTRELVVIGHQAWDTLVIIDPKTSEIKPLLATKWAWVNPTTLEMELRKDVKFHSGQPMDADDVAYTLNFVSNKDNAISNYALLAFIKSAEKIDPYKVRITLHNPFPPALANLAGLGFIMQKGHYDKAPVKPDGKKDFGAVPPNGTGPYKITEVKPGQSILMVKNPDYFKGGYKGDPAISKILFRTIKDANTRAAELMTGAIDWLWDVPKDQAERLQANPALVVENAKTLRVSYLQFDAHGVSGQKFFTDKRVRQAVAHAINRESLTKNLVGPASVVAHSPCHPDQFGCSDKVTRYPYDPAKAKALLKEAGFPDGFEFDLFAYRDREYTEAVIGDLAKVGIRPKLSYLQYTAFLEAVRKGRAPVAHGTWGSNSIPDVSAMTAHFFLHGPDDITKDAEVKKLIDAADSQLDPEQRRLAWQKVLERIADECFWVPLFTYAKYYAFSKDLAFVPTSDEIPQFYAAKWK
ncbi:MAG TPA: ABC transporter substrate-binding protein [Hyphomicrobiaceae bacterium]|jgi:peptide/nickel transport system substrate-binding protein|nr:ABC transporter substrate-binding protein [Hyphomicrobiaceae bacterium]